MGFEFYQLLLALVSTAILKMSSYTIEVVPFGSYDWTFEKGGWLNLKWVWPVTMPSISGTR